MMCISDRECDSIAMKMLDQLGSRSLMMWSMEITTMQMNRIIWMKDSK